MAVVVGNPPRRSHSGHRTPPLARLALALGALVLLAGCASPPGAESPPGTGTSSTRTITVNGTARSFRLYRPPALSPTQPAPLVVMIHGGGGTAASTERTYGWDAAADNGHFVVAYPDGINRGWSVGGGCCHFTNPTTVTDDVDFISQLVATVRDESPVDPARIYATGISEGGMMSYRLACQTTIFAAIGPDSATLLGECPAPPPVSVIHIHGTADTRIPYDGSAGVGVHHIHGPAVPALNATWRTTDQCAVPSVARSGVTSTSTARCPGGRGVELITIDGAGHQWPGAACNHHCAAGTADQPSTALNATATIWRFFADHPKTGTNS